MTVNEYVAKVKSVFTGQLNTFLTSKNLDTINNFFDNAFDVESEDLSLAVYLASPAGEVLKTTPTGITASCTIEFYLNDSADADSVNNCQSYLSAITEFILSNSFSEYDNLSAVQLNRMDMGDAANGCFFLIESRIQSINDYDWQ